MANPFDSIKNIIEKGKKAKKKAAWEMELRKSINKVSVLADIDTECQQLERMIDVEVKKINYGKSTEVEKQMSKRRIDNAYCCIAVLNDAKRHMQSTYADSDIFGVTKNVAKTLGQVNRYSGLGFNFGTKNIGTMVDNIKANEEERSAEIENLIPQILSSSELNTISERLISKGETVNTVLQSDENLSIESQIQSVMLKTMQGNDDEIQGKLDSLKKFE